MKRGLPERKEEPLNRKRGPPKRKGESTNRNCTFHETRRGTSHSPSPIPKTTADLPTKHIVSANRNGRVYQCTSQGRTTELSSCLRGSGAAARRRRSDGRTQSTFPLRIERSAAARSRKPCRVASTRPGRSETCNRIPSPLWRIR